MRDAMHGYHHYGYHPWGGAAVPQQHNNHQHHQYPPPMPPPLHPPDEFDNDNDYSEEEEEDDYETEDDDRANGDLEEENDNDEDEEEDEDEAEIVEEPGTDDGEDHLVVEPVGKSLPQNRKRPRPSAFAYLQSLLQPDSFEMSLPAQNILKDLLRQEHIQLAEPVTDADYALEQASTRLQSKRAVDVDMSDAEILNLAKNNELSYLASFLKVVEEAKGEESVTAKTLTRRCCLAVNPAFVPASMDAEDFVLAALAFLESSTDNDKHEHPHLPQMPLLRAERPENDIRKRSYRKAYDWKLEDILDSMSNLENIFLMDASKYKWLRREAFGPMNMDAAASEALFLKGRFRASSVKKKAPASRKKPKPAPVTGGGGSVSDTKDPVAKEASRVMQQVGGSRSGDDSS